MATLVCFHAHPDDEALTTGGTMARAAAEGHRIVLVVATDGAEGEVPDDLVAGETLPERRRAETEASAAALGVGRVVHLGYRDSGMTGWAAHDHPDAFCGVDPVVAGARLAEICEAEDADVLTIYDWHGGYGHPDHVAIHRVGVAAERLAAARGRPLRVLEATINRDALRSFVALAADAGLDAGPEVDGGEFDPDAPMDDGNPMGTPEAEITLAVDVRGFTAAKRSAIAAHRSQVSDSSFFLEMSSELFALAFGTEWFVERDRPGPMRSGWIFDPA